MATKRIVAPTRKGIVLPPVRPNAGLTAAYQRRLETLVDELHASLIYWLKAAYRKNEPEMLAEDASPAAALRRAMRRLARRWISRFDEAAPELAAWFAKTAADRSDKTLRAILKKAGFAVEFRLSRAQNDVLQATVGQNVTLIKSIAQEHLAQVEGIVLRSVQTGRDLGTLAQELEHRYGVTKNRAAFISRSQNNIATAALTRVRQQELGIEKAIWLHSGGGRHPRPEHVKASRDRLVYEVKKGAFLEGKWTWPGVEPNCFPGDTLISLGDQPLRLWRTPFNGPMIHVQIGTDLLKGTPNHPVLTSRGWIPICELECGDQVVCVANESRNVVRDDEHNCKTTFSELFEACLSKTPYVRMDGRGFDFHGHRPDSYVDEIIVVNSNLLPYRQSAGSENFSDFHLAETNIVPTLSFRHGANHVSVSDCASAFDIGAPLLNAFSDASLEASFAAAAHYAKFHQNTPDIRRSVPGRIEVISDGRSAETAFIERDDFVSSRVPVNTSINSQLYKPELFAEFVRIAAYGGCRVFQFGSMFYEFRSVSDKRIRDFAGHVFTMQTTGGYYSAGSALVQAKNCRCVARSVIEGFS